MVNRDCAKIARCGVMVICGLRGFTFFTSSMTQCRRVRGGNLRVLIKAGRARIPPGNDEAHQSAVASRSVRPYAVKSRKISAAGATDIGIAGTPKLQHHFSFYRTRGVEP